MKVLKYTLILMSAVLMACAPKVDRSTAPEPGPAPDISLGNYETFKLDNGLNVIVVQNDKLPRVSYRLTVDRDPIMEGPKAGFVGFAGDLLKAGTENRSKAQIDEAVDFMGASLSTYSTGMSGSCLKKHSEELLELMNDILLNPTFPEEELEKVRKQTLSGLASAKTSADQISGNITRAMTYSLQHPYGEQQTEKTTEAITREDLVAYYKTFFRPNISYLVVVGDISAEEAKSQANKYFGEWEMAEVPELEYPTPIPPKENKVAFVPLRGAVQSVISITQPVDLAPGHPDAIATSVMNSILGGGVFGGRLMQNLREDKAFTYGARSSLITDELVGRFQAGASVRNEVTDSAITEFLYEIERLTLETVEDTTLRFIKNYMNGSFARSLESPQTIARFALNIERYNLPKDYYATYLTKLEAVTKEDILRVAQRYIMPNNLYITVVGNKDEVADKLVRFAGSGEVDFYDMYGQPYTDMEAAPEGMTASDVFAMYYDAVGGADKLKDVNSVIEQGKMITGPTQLDYERKVKGNNKMSMSVMMGGQALMQQVVNGDQGSSSQMGQSQPMTEDQILEAKMQMNMLAFESLDQYNMTAELKGITNVNDQRVYVVDMMKGGEVTSTNYFSVETGLMTGSESTQETPQGDITVGTTIREYMTVMDLKFPSYIVQSVGPQTIEVKLDEIQINRRINDSEFKVN